MSARTDHPPESTAAETFTLVDGGPESAGLRADRFLAEAIGSLSRSRVKALIAAGRASRDGKPLRDACRSGPRGQHLRAAVPPAVSALPLPQDIPLTILYEDADLIVLDKPAGLVVHPAPGNLDGTLVNALLAHAGRTCPASAARSGRASSTASTRTPPASWSWPRPSAPTGRFGGLRRPGPRPRYLALVWGLPNPASRRDRGGDRPPPDRPQADGGGGAWRQARADPLCHRTRLGRRLRAARCRLATGRTHQIRVHLAEIGHPVVGDPVYLRRTPARPAAWRSRPAGRCSLSRARRCMRRRSASAIR